MAGPDTDPRRRLKGWKAIAAFLKVDVRTARRWEAERALPVHRLPGDSRSPVWADPAELSAWLVGPGGEAAAGPPAPEAPPPAPDAPPPAPEAPPVEAPPRRRLVRGLQGALLLGLAGVAAAFLFLRPATPARAPLASAPDGEVARLMAAANYAKASRSPAGLAEAASLYTRLAQAHPEDPAAFAGLADTWLLMREFAGLPDEAAFRAHQQTAHYLAWKEAVAPLMAEPRQAERMHGVLPEPWA